MSVRLFVGNLPYDVTENDLKEFFSPVGRLSRVFLPVDRETGKQRGFAFVELGTQGEADDAIQRLNQQSFKGRAIAVKEALARESRGPAPPRGSGPARPFSAAFSPRPGSRPEGSARAPAALDELAPQKRRNRNFGAPARPDRKKRPQTKPHKSEWGKKAFLRSRLDDEFDEDLEYKESLEADEGSQDDLIETEVRDFEDEPQE